MGQYTTDQLMKAAKKAMAAGDEDTARVLFTQARDQSLAESEQTSRGMYTIPSAIRQTLQGPTFGTADEIEAAARAPFSDQTYGQIHGDLARTRKAYQAQHPKAAFAQEVLGGLAGGGAGAAALSGTRAGAALGRASAAVPSGVQVAGAGAATGGAYGAGTADPGERLAGAGLGAGIGAGAGIAGKLVIDKVVAPLAARIGRNIASTERGDAKRLILRAMESSGMQPQDALVKMQTMGPDAVLADLSPALRQLGIEATSIAGSDARTIAEKALIPRAQRQQDVIWDFTNRIMDNPPGKKASLQLITANQRRMAKPLYDEAYRAEIPLIPELQGFLDVPWIKKAYKKAQNLAQLEKRQKTVGTAWDPELQDFTSYPDMMEWDLIQRGLRLEAESKRIKSPSTARALYRARDELLGYLDEINPAFKDARQTYAHHEALKDAMDAGEKFLKEDEELLEEFVQSMTESERAAYMVGVAKTLRREIMGMGKNRNVALNKVFNTPLYQQKLNSVLGEEKAGKVLEMADNLGQQSLTMNKTLNRSPTADILSGQQQMQGPGSLFDLTKAATDAVLGQPSLSIRNADYLASMLYGRPPSAQSIQPILGGLVQLPQRLGEVTPAAYGLLGAQAGNYLGVQ